MKELTKRLKDEFKLDNIVLSQVNNNKFLNTDYERLIQSINDRHDYYHNKWSAFLMISTTQRQIYICKQMLTNIEFNRERQLKIGGIYHGRC